MPSRLFTCMPLDHATQGCHCQICSRDISTRTPLGCAGCGSGPELCKDLRGCLAEVPITPCVPSWNPALWAQAVDLDPSYAKASEAVWQRYPSRTVSPFEALPCGRRLWIWTQAMQRRGSDGRTHTWPWATSAVLLRCISWTPQWRCHERHQSGGGCS